jgi:hypothetical protein
MRLPPVGFANAKIDRTFIVISHKNEMSIECIRAASVSRPIYGTYPEMASNQVVKTTSCNVFWYSLSATQAFLRK